MARKRSEPEPAPVVPPYPPLQLLDVNGIADLFQIGRTKVFQLIREEGLPHIRWGQILRFDPYAIAHWLEGQSQQE